MALLGDREVYIDDISFISEAVESAGKIMIFKATQGTGIGVGQAINDSAPIAVSAPGTPASTSKPAGLLVNDIVSLDQTRYHRNHQKTDHIVGEQITLYKKAKVFTNQITGTPAAGDLAYLSTSGTVSATQVSGSPLVGKFMSSKNTDGYAKLFVDIS